jgi:hypothetical protein
MSGVAIIAATIPAYLAAGIALLLGMGWVASLTLMIGTGVAITLGMGACLTLRSSQNDPAADLGQAIRAQSQI